MSYYYYVDTSALVKRYLNEIGSQWIRQLFIGLTSARQIFIVTVTGVEMSSAFSRKFRLGDISQSVYRQAMGQFEGDFRYRYSRIRVTHAVIRRAMDVAKQHPLRGYDAVQLAAALELKDRLQSISSANLTFLSADDALCQIAAREGLLTDNPNHHP
jgi:predicted nucleic acid-binding protein